MDESAPRLEAANLTAGAEIIAVFIVLAQALAVTGTAQYEAVRC